MALGPTLALAVLALLSPAVVLLRYRTALLGFWVLGFWTLASGSLSAVVFDTMFGLNTGWISEQHLIVFRYTSWGLLAFTAGVWLAWRPLRRQTTTDLMNDGPAWLSARCVVRVLTVGAAATVLAPLAFRIPSITSVWSAFEALLQVGVLLALVLALVRRTYALLLIAGLVFVLFSAIETLRSGFIGPLGTFMLQMAAVAVFWRGLGLRTAACLLVAMVLLGSLQSTWLQVRGAVRQNASGDLIERANGLAQEASKTPVWVPNADAWSGAIHARTDVSGVLAAQVGYQPEIVPFAGGATMVDQLLPALAPRAVWADKSIRAGGSEFVAAYSGLSWTGETSVGLPYQFELYANWGETGVLIGFFVIGWLLARIELWVIEPRHSFFRALVLMYAGLVLSSGVSQVVLFVMACAGGIVAYWPLTTMLTFWERRSVKTVRKLTESVPRMQMGPALERRIRAGTD